MKSQFKKWMIVILSVAAFVFCVGTPTKAYTEEEKQQAKAWLSSHGYSPDAGGAQQAYQDYLNGKFDDELGITREETTEEADTSTENETEAVTEEEKTEAGIATESNAESTKSPSVTTEAKTTSSEVENPTTGSSEETGEKGTDEKNTEAQDTEEKDLVEKDTETQDTAEKNSEELTTEDTSEAEEISAYKKKKNTKHIFMIAFCVVLFGIVIFAVKKLTQKENKEI